MGVLTATNWVLSSTWGTHRVLMGYTSVMGELTNTGTNGQH